MYPNLYYAFRDLFGLELPFLKIINSFGFFVALAFLMAAWLLIKELKRKEAGGQFSYIEHNIIIGKPANFAELLINFILGFILGFKIIGVFITAGALDDPQSFLFSGKGNMLAGILLGLFFAVLKWREKNKSRLKQPEERTIRIWPSDRVGDITIIAAIAGFAGAKIFDNLENWDRFIQDPIGNLISPSGLTFYGGLILATFALWYYFNRNHISFIKVADAASPPLMLAYAIGRVGCQVSGDGDWGIINPFGKPFSWLPNWAWAYTYPHNVNKEGSPIAGCDWGEYCNQLPMPVYPTPLYEILMALIIFAILWALRKRIKITGRLFGVYLLLNGIERFTIEQIRVNNKMPFLGIQATQAEIIAVLLIITGIILYVYSPKLKVNRMKKEAAKPA